MKLSTLFGKTTKHISSEIKLPSHRLLIQGGFIQESVAGRYYFLPLGIRVQDKIQRIIEEEMDAAGAQKMITPVLHPLELWEETNRTSSVGFELMTVADQRGARFALGGTAEEMMVDVVRKYTISYKDLPFNIYQFSQKFRDEKRARGGLLRVREFMMKDAYSFHADEEDFTKEYKSMWDTYVRIFNRLGLSVLAIESDNGYIGGDYCHEFVVECEAGESKFFKTEDGSYAAHAEVTRFKRDAVNLDEEVLPMETIEQPQWVCSMEDNEKHYGLPAKRFLKNVVFRNHEGDIIIGVIRGDLNVDAVKLTRVAQQAAELEEATDEDLAAIGTKNGYVHSWGHQFVTPRRARTQDRDCQVIYVADESLRTVVNFIGGQKEDTTDTRHVNYGRDFTCDFEGDIAEPYAGALSLDGKPLIESKGVEVGNIFQLGHHYSSKMKANFVDRDGKTKPYYMGCYGIGVGRTMATIVEQLHDEKGILWPKDIAPYQVVLITIGKDQEIIDASRALYDQLRAQGVEVLWDDREQSPGVKFADADLMGIPVRMVLSPKTLGAGQVEVKKRTEDTVSMIALDDVLSYLRS